MANNKSIQILRTKEDSLNNITGITDNNKEVILLDGQPFYNEQKNYLTVGDGTKTASGEPITVRKLMGYFKDNEDGITNLKGEEDEYSIQPSDSSLDISSGKGISLKSSTGISIDNSTHILSTLNSTDKSTGALVVDGGVGVAGDLNVGGTLKAGGKEVAIKEDLDTIQKVINNLDSSIPQVPYGSFLTGITIQDGKIVSKSTGESSLMVIVHDLDDSYPYSMAALKFGRTTKTDFTGKNNFITFVLES